MQPMQGPNWMGAGGARMRIGLAFSALAIVVFGSVGYFSVRDAREQSERVTALALQQLADRLALRLDADMAARFREVAQTARLFELLDIQPSPVRWRQILEDLQRASHHYSWIGVTDLSGTVVASTQGLLEAVDVHKRPWFAKGLKAPSVLDVHEAKLLASLLPTSNSGEPLRFVDVAAPVKAHGQVVGVIAAHLSWAWAEEQRRQALAGDAADRDIDILIVAPDGKIELGPHHPALPMAAGERLQTLLPTAGMLTWSDAQRYLSAASASKPLNSYPGMGWWVVVRQPESTALADTHAMERRLMWLSALGALLFGVLGWLLAHRLTRPLRAVAAQARTLMTNHPGPVLYDEVDQLARSLTSLLADLKQRETDLRTLNEQLELRVQERTAALRLANEDLQGFSRSVSHDFQGPLGSMALLLRRALQRDLNSMDGGTARTLEMVAQECDRLRQLSAELLALAMVEQQALRPQAVDHTALVNEVIAQLRASHNQARFPEVDIGPLPTLPGDPVLLRQVWANLLSNAVKFSGKAEHPRIEVRASREGRGYDFCVADNGVGFDPSQAGRLFGVFQRLHAASQFPGTGVGLSIVRRVAERHGGRAWAESTPGKGACFHVHLPEVVNPPDAPEVPHMASVQALPAEATLH